MYGLLSRFFGALADLFYRRTKRGLLLPETGPLLIVANHPNGLVDPLLLLRDAGRPIRFLAKEPLFRMPIIGALLRALGALPVFRPKDGHDTSKNEETFRAVEEALGHGAAIAIFPEGTSHSEPSLRPLKTGAARMALSAEARHEGKLGVLMVPVGLLYRNKSSFRSEAVTLVGEPVAVRDFLDLHRRDPLAGVRALTEAVDAKLRAVTINLERWEDEPLARMAARIWRPDEGHPLERMGLVAEGERSLRVVDPGRVERLRTRVQELARALDALGLGSEQLEARYEPSVILRFVVRNLIASFVGLPVALAGAIGYFVPYQLVKLMVAVLRPERDLEATYKLLLSLCTYPVGHTTLVVFATARFGGVSGFLTSVLLPPCGLYTLHFISRRRAAGRALWAFLRLPLTTESRQALIRERDWIRSEMNELALLYEGRSNDAT